MLVMVRLLLSSPGPSRSTARREARQSGALHREAEGRRGTPDQGRRGQPEGQHGPQVRGLRRSAAEPGGAEKGDGSVR